MYGIKEGLDASTLVVPRWCRVPLPPFAVLLQTRAVLQSMLPRPGGRSTASRRDLIPVLCLYHQMSWCWAALPRSAGLVLTRAVLQSMLPKLGVQSGRSTASGRAPTQIKPCGLAAGAAPRVRKQRSFRQVAPATHIHGVMFLCCSTLLCTTEPM